MEKVMNRMGETLAKTCRYATETTGKITKKFQLKSQMADNKCKIKDLYEKIGQKVYENYVLKEEEIPSDLKQDCVEIDALAAKVEEIRMQILKLNDLKQCPNCHYEIELDYTYCPNCGKKQKLTKEAKQNDGPATLVTTEGEDSVLKQEENEKKEEEEM